MMFTGFCVLLLVTWIFAADSDLESRYASLVSKRSSINAEIVRLRNILDSDTCSGNGFWYDDINGCNCFTCFSGEDCSKFESNCVITDTGGNPKLFEYYWRNHSELITSEEIYYRAPYQFETSIPNEYITTDYDPNSPYQGSLLPLLSSKIIELHSIFGNILNVDKKNIVIGHGGTELINALDYACRELYGNGNMLHVYARPPYYSGYPVDFVQLGVKNLDFSSSSNLDPTTVIEYVTLPNNPTNDYRKPFYDPSKSACTIYDNVYYWPSLYDDITPLDTSINLFSMSKLTGHGGMRFGWALVDDMTLANKMSEFISNVQISISIDTQYRTYTMLDFLTKNNGTEASNWFAWLKNQMSGRWTTINSLFDPSKQDRFIQHAQAGGFYCWVECLYPGERQACAAVFETAGIEPTNGPAYGGNTSFVRLELVVAYPVWDILVQRLGTLV